MHNKFITTKLTSREDGAALLAAIFVALVIAGVVGIALNHTQGIGKQVDTSRDYSDLRFESEGALETAYGIWLKAANAKYGPPNSADIDSTVRGPTPPTANSPFNFPYASGGQLKIDVVDDYGAPLPTTTSTLPAAVYVDLPEYPGWKGVKFSYTASVKLAKSSASSAQTYGLKRTIEYVSVPLFQAMGFFQDDIEFYKPAPMIIAGLVHTNHKAYMSGGTTTALTFQNNTSNVDGYTSTEYPTGATAWNNSGSNYSPVFSNGGQSAQVNTVSTLYPLGTRPESVLSTTDSNPNNDSMRELIEPPVAGYADDPAIADRRLYTKAGIIVKITGPASVATNITITTQNGVALTAAQITTIKSAITAQTITDRRENKTVDVSTVDINAIRSTLSAATGFTTNGVLYVYDTSSSGASDPKAVRLKNGGTLPPTGLTVVSENPIYIQGDYNTGSTSATVNNVPSNNGGNPSNTDSPVVSGYTKAPSAVIGDAVTILSNTWNDSNSANALSSRPASSTTVNTAIVTGNIPSGWDPDSNSATNNSYGYSGGFNNFPRFLEDWTNDSFTYFGSMVQLFTSKTFTGEWDTGAIYAAPNRAWNFDSSFLATPPPGSLDVVTRTRGNLIRF
ncbi:MAG: hypothetical protein ABIT76_01705 [Chthoniobacterales bacterium]